MLFLFVVQLKVFHLFKLIWRKKRMRPFFMLDFKLAKRIGRHIPIFNRFIYQCSELRQVFPYRID